MAWMSEFERNTLKRAEIENRRKKCEKSSKQDLDFKIQDSMTKKAEIQRRLEDRDSLNQKKQAAMIRKWEKDKNLSTQTAGQKVIQENSVLRKEIDNRRHQLHQINM